MKDPWKFSENFSNPENVFLWYLPERLYISCVYLSTMILKWTENEKNGSCFNIVLSEMGHGFLGILLSAVQGVEYICFSIHQSY